MTAIGERRLRSSFFVYVDMTVPLLYGDLEMES
jgi:hypothetical protein